MLPAWQTSKGSRLGPSRTHPETSVGTSGCAQLRSSSERPGRKESRADRTDPCQAKERASSALPGLRESGTGAKASSHAGLRRSTALSNCTRSEIGSMEPGRPHLGAGVGEPKRQQERRDEAESDFKGSRAGGGAPNLAELLGVGEGPSTLRSTTGEEESARATAGAEVDGASRPWDCGGTVKPRWRRSRASGALPSHTTLRTGGGDSNLGCGKLVTCINEIEFTRQVLMQSTLHATGSPKL